jgi:anti-sigma regulatory factor (Ser/Thr protein kinase)
MDPSNLTRVRVTPSLNEDRVWQEQLEPKLADLRDNVRRIVRYCATEMINNVIDHAKATELFVGVRRTDDEVECWLGDNGVGIFQKLQSELGLEDARHVALELAKGKLTTDPRRHTGEGIFFSAKMCDRFLIESDTVACGHVEDSPWYVDQNVADPSPWGTAVLFTVRLDTRRTPESVFAEFAPPDLEGGFGFTRTEIPADLAGADLVSRSQAKRLLARCEHFKEVTLDFTNVASVTPAFADEAFRVWPSQHPTVTVRHVNANRTIGAQIARARRNGKPS